MRYFYGLQVRVKADGSTYKSSPLYTSAEMANLCGRSHVEVLAPHLEVIGVYRYDEETGTEEEVTL